MSYNYSTFQTALALEMAIPNNNVGDSNFQLILPTIIDYAEQRCYRELDLLYATTGQVGTLTANDRRFLTSSFNPVMLIVDWVNVITPAGTTDPNLGTRNELSPVAPEWLNAVYNSATGAGLPRYFAMQTDTGMILGPWPDQAYSIEVFGKYRPDPLYTLGPSGTTWLTTYVPDLFLAAAMVSASGYRHNFGAQADEPRMAVAWESQYELLLASALKEEVRKKFHGWQQNTSQQTPVPNP